MPLDMTKGWGAASMGNWLAAERVAGPEPSYPTQAKARLEWGTQLFVAGALDCREPAHLAVFQGEMLATPGHGVSREAPNPDAQRHHVARRQQPQIAQYLAITQHTHTDRQG